MQMHTCHFPSGEIIALRQDKDGAFLCPVCGRNDFYEPPYSDSGSPSFEICECGFQFGFDDSSLAANDAVEGIEKNWVRWRRRLIDSAKRDPEELKDLERRLYRIGRRLAFDLVDVELEEGEQRAAYNTDPPA